MLHLRPQLFYIHAIPFYYNYFFSLSVLFPLFWTGLKPTTLQVLWEYPPQKYFVRKIGKGLRCECIDSCRIITTLMNLNQLNWPDWASQGSFRYWDLRRPGRLGQQRSAPVKNCICDQRNRKCALFWPSWIFYGLDPHIGSPRACSET